MAIVRNKSVQLLIVLIGIVCLANCNSYAAKKVALVIGTDAYQNLPVLQKAVNDARAISETLTNIGFEVVKGENLTRRQMNRSLANLERTISPGDQVFFFFAGHGVALGATNYLIPVDMPLPEAGDEGLVRGEAFAVDRIVDRIRARGAIASFVVLDACRNNPFKTKGVRSIGTTRGLRDVSAPKGVFVLFSAGIGQTALDRLHDSDENPNSVFTRNLVPLLKEPGLSHVQLAKRVQSNVDKLARTIRHEQQPAYYDQVIGNMYLAGLESSRITQTQSNETKTDIKQTQTNINQLQTSQAERAFGLIKDSKNLLLLKTFVKKYPNSFHASIISARIQELNERKIKVEVKKQIATESTLSPPVGVLLAFSTESGSIALDGEGDNSPYALALATALDAPGKSLQYLLKNVRQSVMENTKYQQKPEFIDSADGPYYLKKQDGTIGDSRAKYALVIGNSEYLYAPHLKNPVSDAKLISSSLKLADFEVDIVTNGSSQVIIGAIENLKRKAKKHKDGAAVVVYYAGHGIEVDGNQYLIPFRAKLENSSQVYDENQAIPISKIKNMDFGEKSLFILFYDTVRINPFR